MQQIELIFGRKTDRGSFTIGIDASYFQEEQAQVLEQFSSLVADVIETIHKETGIELSVTVVQSTNVSCCKTSKIDAVKDTFTVSSVRNPKVYGEIKKESWKLAFMSLAETLKKEMNQSNIVLGFDETEFFCIA